MRTRGSWSKLSGLVAVSLALTGCGHISFASPSHAHHHPGFIGTLSALSPKWVMPNALPQTPDTRWERANWPLYNAQLAMNQFPASWHGLDPVNHWRLPPGWVPYLYKTEHQVPPFVDGHRPLVRLPLTLYITLQGVVFLYPQTIMQSEWPATPTVGNIPPATIVAEFVPLKPAVEAGIIPVMSQPMLQPVTASGFLPRVWHQALGLSYPQVVRLTS